MKTFFTLFKTSLNINFGISALKYRFTKEKKQIWEPILIGISILIGIGTIIGLACLIMFGFFIAGKALHKPELVLTLSLASGQLIILVFGIFYLMGSFYFARDLNILLPLPLKPSQVLGSKFAVVMFNEYLTLTPILLPAFIIYGVGTGQGILYWIKSMIVFLTAPAIPLTLGALFVLVLMRFVNVRKNKDLFAIVGGFVGLLAAVGFNFFVQRMPKGNEGDLVNGIAGVPAKIVELIGQKFPPSLWATYGLARSGLGGLSYLAVFVGVSLLLFAVLMWIGNRVFYKSFISGEEITRKRKRLPEKQELQKLTTEKSPVMALFLKEWRVFIRTPIYLMNGVAGMVMAPFLLIMPFIADKTKGESVFNIIMDAKFAPFVSLGGLGVMLFAANINIIANTSLSREGQMFWISKMIPVSPKQQVIAKILHSLAVEFIGLIVTGIVLVAVIKLSAVRVFVLILLGVLGSLLIIVLNLMVDVVRPKLEWTNPQEAVKRNINGLLGMLVTMFVMGVLTAVALLLIFIGLPEWLVYISLAVVIIILAIPSTLGLFGLAEQRYSRLEV